MQWKWINTYSPSEKKLRLLRLIRHVEPVGFGGHSDMLTISLVPRMFRWIREIGYGQREVVLFGVRLHFSRSFGGRHAI